MSASSATWKDSCSTSSGAPASIGDDLTVSYISLAGDTGYAVAARKYLALLQACGLNPQWLPLVPGPGLGLAYELEFGALSRTRLQHPSMPAGPGSPAILHTVPEYYPALTGKLRELGHSGPILGMTVWETTRLPQHWPALLNRLDAVIVPTDWNRSVFQESGVTVPIHVVPHASEFEGLPATAADIASLRSRLPDLAGKLVFYSIGTAMKRKGNDLLVQAFLEAFAGRDDVVLILKTSSTDLDRARTSWLARALSIRNRPQWQAVAKANRAPRIVLLTHDLTSGEVQALHTIADVYISLARGEGWGLGLYEAAFFGNPVITSGFGGQTAFAPPALSFHVRHRLVPVDLPGNRSYTPDQMWAEPDLQHAVELLRSVAEHGSEARRRSAALQEHVRHSFSTQRIGQDLCAILRNPMSTDLSPRSSLAVLGDSSEAYRA